MTRGLEEVYLVEDDLFFGQYRFHKKKLVLHRASMKYYQHYLEDQGFKTCYVNSTENPTLEDLFVQLKTRGVTKVHLVDPTDYLLLRRVRRFSKKEAIALSIYPSPLFLNSTDELRDRLKKTKSGYLMASFYKAQRKAMGILVDGNEPLGGKWSFDEENRKKLPKQLELPVIYKSEASTYVKEATKYVNEHFQANPGSTSDFFYPVTHEEALKGLDDFLENRMRGFGDYEDAIAKGKNFLFHSVLTPPLNVGLLTPDQVILRTLERHAEQHYPLNSLEGFIRQVIGWREFMRGIYEREGVFQRTNNHFKYQRPLPSSFWTASTGIDPIDDVILKVLHHGYCHHIERLMILGNFMLLCEFDPDAVYQWFMELFIDAYDWVMVPNIYGMTQYADGGLLSTKPYVSGSNYILKMSDYKKGDWCKTWDALYWRFIHIHKQEFAKNQRMTMIVRLLEKMDAKTLAYHLEIAQRFLSELS